MKRYSSTVVTVCVGVHAAMTDKRDDLLLTLVFLKFIGERIKQQKEKVRHEIVEVQGINDTDFIELQLSRPNQYMQDGVFSLIRNR